jgi:SAM-dependent methyltransferase
MYHARSFPPWRPLAVAFVGGVMLSAAHAQNLDVVYVPTPQPVVNRMLEIAAVGPNDYVIDLGCGDGRTVVSAAKRGAKSLGVDLDPRRIAEAQANVEKAEVGDKAAIRQQNLFETDISEATVLTLYLLPEINRKLRPRILKLKPGTRVVSHDFDMGSWKADRFEKLGASEIYYWVVPARVAGRWRVKAGDREFTVSIRQHFQRINGTATIGRRTLALRSAKLSGDEIEFVTRLGGKRVTLKGKVDGNTITGKSDAGAEWSASRL